MPRNILPHADLTPEKTFALPQRRWWSRAAHDIAGLDKSKSHPAQKNPAEAGVALCLPIPVSSVDASMLQPSPGALT